jgi:hypothetical protein
MEQGRASDAGRFCFVFEDLRLERFGRGPLDLAAQAQQKLQFDGRLRSRSMGSKVQDVRLDGKGRLAEGGPVADVGDRLKAAPADRQPRDVDAEGGQQPVVGARLTVGTSSRVPMPRPRACVERTSKGRPSIQRARVMSPAATRPDGGAGNLKAVRATRTGDGRGRQSRTPRQSLELGDAGLGAMAEAEVAALVQAAQAESFHQNGAHKLPRGQRGQRRIEGQHQHRVDAGEASRRRRSSMGVSSRGA